MERIQKALTEYKGWKKKALLETVRNREWAFRNAGGRGVELAEEIDSLWIAYHARKLVA